MMPSPPILISKKQNFNSDVLELIFDCLAEDIAILPYTRVHREISQLLAICLSNSQFRPFGQALIYKRIVLRLDFDPWGVYLTQALNENPILSKLVKQCDVQTWDSSISEDSFIIMENIWRLCTNIKFVSFNIVRPLSLNKALMDLAYSPLASTLRRLDLVHPSAVILPSFLENSPVNLYEILERFPVLTSISFQSGSIQFSDYIPIFTNSISCLLFNKCTLESTYQLISLVSKTLRSLSLIDCPCSEEDTLEFLPIRCTSLTSFTLSITEVDSNWLVALLVSFTFLESFNLNISGFSDVTEENTRCDGRECADWVILALPSTVRTLKLDLGKNSDYLERFYIWCGDKLKAPCLKHVKLVGVKEKPIIFYGDEILITLC